jgi:O-antigen ligase
MSRRAIIGLALAIAILLAALPIVGVPLACLALIAIVRRYPGTIVALSWSGFWLYLGGLSLLGIHTRTAYTVVAYAAIACALGLFAWSRRALLVQRLRRSDSIGRVWLAAATLLAISFAVGSLVTGHGPLPHRLLGVLVIATIPTAIAIAAFRRRDFEETQAALVVLGIVFTTVDLIASRHGAPASGRFSPIRDLDPISASLIGAVACIAAVAYRPATSRARLAQAAVCLYLAAGSAVNGSRGPAVALIFAILVLVAIEHSRRIVALGAAVALGLFAGSVVEQYAIGQPPPLASLVHETTSPNKPQQPDVTSVPLSSMSIRRQWLMSALRQVPDKPLLGHGVGMLVDNTPEAAAMGIKGERVYPHNDAVEAAFSLGIPGTIFFAAFLLLPLLAFWRRRTELNRSLTPFVLGLFSFAFAESNFSGEIGTDVILWSTALYAVFLLAEPAE